MTAPVPAPTTVRALARETDVEPEREPVATPHGVANPLEILAEALRAVPPRSAHRREAS